MASKQGNYSFSIVDVEGVRAALTLPVVFIDTVTMAQLDAGWQAMATLVDAVIGGQIQRGKVSIVEPMAGGKGAPAADSEVEQVGVFDFAISGSTHKQGIAVPSLSDTKVTAGRIALADADVAAFTAAVAAAITGGGVYATPDGVTLGALVDAFLAFRKHRRQLRSLSLEL